MGRGGWTQGKHTWKSSTVQTFGAPTWSVNNGGRDFDVTAGTSCSAVVTGDDVLSGAFQVEKQYFLQNVLTPRSARKKPLRIYLDSGTCDYTGGDDGLKHTEAVALQLQHFGWKPGIDLLHHIDRPLPPEQLKPFNLPEDKFNEAQRSQHNELYWRLRASRALSFLFPLEATR